MVSNGRLNLMQDKMDKSNSLTSTANLDTGNYRLPLNDEEIMFTHFQPRTRPACLIHLRIKGSCASSRVAIRQFSVTFETP